MKGHLRTPPQIGNATASIQDRLNSWKEIAAFFDKDVRTVRRWEASRKLPVRRVPGGGRSGVFAYTAELQLWLVETDIDDNVENTGVDNTGDANANSTSANSAQPDPEAPARLDPTPLAGPLPAAIRPPTPRRPAYPLLTYLIPAGILLAALILFATRQTRQAPAQLVQISSPPPSQPAAGSPVPAAQELYLQGLNVLNQRTAESLTAAVDLFTQAIVRDPHFASAYAGLADTYILLRQYGSMTDRVAFSRALAASRQSLALDERSPEAHRTYAFLLNFWMWDFPAADREFKRSLELRPEDAQTHHWYATTLQSAGRFNDALREIDSARRLAPDSPAILANRGFILCFLDPHQGIDYLTYVKRSNPGFAMVHSHLANCYADIGDYQSFLAEFREASRLRHDVAAEALYRRAQQRLATQGVQPMLTMMGETIGRQVDLGRPDAMQAALYFARLHDSPRTLHYLQLAGERHEASFIAIDQDPAYRWLNNTPQFQSLLTLRHTPLKLEASAS